MEGNQDCLGIAEEGGLLKKDDGLPADTIHFPLHWS